MQSAHSKISQALSNSNNICTKRGDKPFDSARAREHMIEQQKKRKLANKSTSSKSKIEREEIQKRLLELRKNSLRIVANNVNKVKRKKSIKSVNSAVSPCKSTANDTQTNVKDVCENSEIVQKNDGISENCSIAAEKQQSDVLPISSGRRIGILRKFDELQPPIGSAKLSNRSPFISDIELGFQKLITSIGKEDFKTNTPSPKKPVAVLTKPEQIESVQKDFSAQTEVELRLIVPDVTLKSDTLSESRQKQDCSTVKSTVNVPYWLKPSPVQAYPYNFITALRKKLEAVTKPTISDTNNKVSTFKTPLARPKYVQTKSSIQSFRDHLHNESAGESDISHHDSESKLQSKSKSSCEYVNSKVTIKPQNHTDNNAKPKAIRTKFPSKSIDRDATDYSESLNESFHASVSKRTENNECGSQDTLSISSAIFSQSSPEKKNSKIEIGEPLSTENINSMKIVSKSCNQSSDLISAKSTSKSMDQSNIIEMLEVFNKSLSQVISANQQLHKALSVDNPVQNVKLSTKGTVDEYSYTSDFDSIVDSAMDPVKVKSLSTSVAEDIKSETGQNEVDSVPIESMRSTAPTTTSTKSAYRKNDSSAQIPTDISARSGATASIVTELSDNITRYRGENYQSPDDEMTKGSYTHIQSISSVRSRELPQYKTSSSSVNQTNPSTFSSRTLIDSVYKEPISVPDNENIPSERENNNTTLGSDIYEFFNQPNTEYKIFTANNQSVLSERSMSYSSIGMVSEKFEILIKI